jgi:hypothetical protein
MSSRGRIRRWTLLGPVLSLLLGTGCGGGGDKSPTGPGGGGDGGTARFELMSIGKVGLPADLNVEDCTLTRFYGGQMVVTDDGSWELRLRVHDGNYGDWQSLDSGEVEDDGNNLWFVSDYSGARNPVEVDGPEIRMMYDWCFNGVPDIQLVLDR